jgi:hypothetical protein
MEETTSINNAHAARIENRGTNAGPNLSEAADRSEGKLKTGKYFYQ